MKKWKTELKRRLQHPTPLRPLQSWEEQIVQTIKEETARNNVNNVKRTAAYLSFYLRFPEIHWAFLAHMVSRNGGWNMTDLKGGLLKSLLDNDEKESIFAFLERGNWLIFQDAFPQLMLYECSVKYNQNLFDLLPYFGVSRFMEAMWSFFWEERDQETLAIATIINEQNYIESRVIQHKTYKNSVLNTWGFQLYDVLPFNHILLPFVETNQNVRPHLAGATVQHFASLSRRIEFGKSLYHLLFHKPSLRQKVLNWAASHPHTGSRADYWNDIFHPIKMTIVKDRYQKRIDHCRLKKEALPIHSPTLQAAWKNVDHEQPDSNDWFQDLSVLRFFKKGKPLDGDILDDYCRTIDLLELAVIARQILSMV
ncbi:DUF2515 family protein [Aeribacillus pallidus]|uniref:DUF2515 family protein n=1 Tax=Aeribacillus pallidus TaxID=33936 RepID=UPI003D1EE882